MTYLSTVSLKFRQSLAILTVLSTLNSSIVLAMDMDIDLDDRKLSYLAQTQPILENDEETKLSIRNSSNYTGMIIRLEGEHLDLNNRNTVPENEMELLSHLQHPSVSLEVCELDKWENREINPEFPNLANSSGNISSNYVLAFKNNDEEKESNFSKLKKISGFLAGIIIFIPQIDVVIATGEYYGSRGLGYALIGLAFLAQGGTGAWITSELMEDTYTLAKKIKKQPSSFWSIDTLNELKYGLLSFVIGALSSSSDIYKVYRYSKIKGLTVITIIWDVVTRTLGIYKIFTSLSVKLTNLMSQEQNIIREKGVQYINSSKRNFLNFIKKYSINNTSSNLENYETPHLIYSYLTSDSEQNLSEKSFIIISRDYEKGCIRKIVIASALIFQTSTIITNSVLSYKGYDLLFNNTVTSTILTVASVIPSSALDFYVVTTATTDIFYDIYLYSKGLKNPDVFNTFYPTINKVFFVSSLFLAVSTSSIGFAIIADNLKDTVFAPIKYVVASVGAISGSIFNTYTILSTIKGYGEEVLKKSSQGTSYVFGCLKKLGDLSNSIYTSSINSVSDFIDQFDPDCAFQ